MPSLPFSDEQVRESHPHLVVEVPPLGQGSFKVAYCATKDAEICVLKVIFSFQIDDDPEDFDMGQVPDRIARELMAMSNVASPYVVTLTARPTVHRIGDYSYLSFEEPFYPGGTLEDALKNGPLDRAGVRQLAIALLSASHALWSSERIVHRDIKPGNIAFDGDGTPVLLDLGLALFTDLSALTDSGLSSPRTPRYAAPEQFEMRRNAQIDFRTDQYLIGLTVFEARAGRHLFWRQGIGPEEYLDAMEHFRADDLDDLDIDDDLREVLGRLLSPAIYGRYRTPELPLEKLGITL